MRSVSLLVFVALAACSKVSRERDAPQTVARGQLQFEQASERERFDTAFGCFAERTGWTQRPLEVHGSFIAGEWCAWEGSCSSTRYREEPGARWARVGTLHYPKDGASSFETFGVQVSVGEWHAQGWSVSVSASSNGKGILGEHAFVNFARQDDTGAAFSIGLRYTWKVAERDFVHVVEEDPWVWLNRVRTSPSALKDETLAAWTGLRDEVVLALDSGQVRKCVYGEYKGDGIPPECVERVPLSAAEIDTERAKIEARLGRIKVAMAEVDTLHAAVVALAPPDCF